MSCGVNIPLSSVVEAIVNDYADVFVGEILKRVSLHNSTINNGTFTDATIRGGLTLDDTAKGALCSALQDCIATKIQDELGCERDNHVTKFYIDKEKDHLVIELKFGERYYVSRAELEDWLKIAAGGIQSGVLIIQDTNPTQIIRVTNKDGSMVDIDVSALKDIKVERGEIVNGQIIRLHRSDGEQIDIDVSALKDIKVERGEIVNGQIIRLHRSDGEQIDIDVSALKDIKVERGEIVNGQIIRLHRSDGEQIDIDASTLASKNSPFIVSGVFVSRDGGYWLDFTRNDNTKVNVDMTAIINELVNTLRTQILGMGYTLKTENNHYTTQAEDFNGFTIIRANHNGDQTITLTKPDDSFIGKALIVRKTNGGVGTFVTLKAGGGVTISPADSTPLRRVGSSATLVYTGGGNWDVFGELP